MKKVRHYQGYLFFILASLTLIYFIRLSSYTQAVIKPLFVSPKMELIQMKEVVLAAYNSPKLQYYNMTIKQSSVLTVLCERSCAFSTLVLKNGKSTAILIKSNMLVTRKASQIAGCVS